MRIAVLSDIHANGSALEAVLEDSWDRVDRYWCLGDLVGYGPDPLPSVRWLQAAVAPDDWVLGNHDALLAGVLLPSELEAVNATPKQTIDLHLKALAKDAAADRFWRDAFRREREQPRLHSLDGMDHLLVHASQEVPLFRYIYPWQLEIILPTEFEQLQAQAQERACPRVQWFGHTHIPTLARARPGNPEGGLAIESVMVIPGQSYRLDAGLALVNPGSVGQPRDLDRRAAYAILDTETRTVTFHRVPYNWQSVYQELQRGYPESLATRLWDARCPPETLPAWEAHFRRVQEMAT